MIQISAIILFYTKQTSINKNAANSEIDQLIKRKKRQFFSLARSFANFEKYQYRDIIKNTVKKCTNLNYKPQPAEFDGHLHRPSL